MRKKTIMQKVLDAFRNEYTCLTTDEIRRALDLPDTPKNRERVRAAIGRLRERGLIYSNPITYSKVVMQ